MHRTIGFMQFLGVLLLLAASGRVAAFDLQFSISDPSGLFSAEQVELLQVALGRAERMWETAIVGYQSGINIPAVPISVYPTTAGLAAANFTGQSFQGGYWLSTGGFININVHEILNFSNWQGPGANGRNYLDELLAHETGHVLGIGTLWDDNGVYVNNSFHYVGQFGVAAYLAEFNDNTTWAPVENAGNPGTPNSHWDQLMRSSPQEGNPMDPYSLDPRVGVVDAYGRDRGLELMTGAIDPDYGEPFLSRFTVESMRDLGYRVARFEDCNGNGAVNVLDLNILLANMGATDLAIDSVAFGDVNRDRRVDAADLALWRQAAPEPPSIALVVLAAASLAGRRVARPWRGRARR
ncbi:MAG: hypothetical protein DCC67_13995 [Planctomycetota bacterium]|nr:MAG: hypothetical protein DCC67_13995 [Planctomycetota bacterium]